MSQASKTTRVSYKDFVLKAIETRPNPEKGKGIHAVFSGFSTAFKQYYANADGTCPDIKEVCKKLEEEGIIKVRGAIGGVILYKAGDAPTSKNGNGDSALKRMGLA